MSVTVPIPPLPLPTPANGTDNSPDIPFYVPGPSGPTGP